MQAFIYSRANAPTFLTWKQPQPRLAFFRQHSWRMWELQENALTGYKLKVCSSLWEGKTIRLFFFFRSEASKKTWMSCHLQMLYEKGHFLLSWVLTRLKVNLPRGSLLLNCSSQRFLCLLFTNKGLLTFARGENARLIFFFFKFLPGSQLYFKKISGRGKETVRVERNLLGILDHVNFTPLANLAGGSKYWFTIDPFRDDTRRKMPVDKSLLAGEQSIINLFL